MGERAQRFTVFTGAGAGLALFGALGLRPAPPPPAAPTAARYPAPVRGERVSLPALEAAVTFDNGAAPTFLHFYDPASPEGRASVAVLAGMVAANRDGARFFAVVESPAGDDLSSRQGLPPGVTVIADPGGVMARACGVNSTPAAVIIDAHGRLYFRGRYGDRAQEAAAAPGAGSPPGTPARERGTDGRAGAIRTAGVRE